MPNTFQDKRDSHLKQAQAFRTAAQTRVSDNLPFRTALSDAVEAIKHSLQSYLWMRVGALFPREPAARLQEVAIKGSMPELLAAAQETGLQLGDVAQRIRDFNDLRNQYTHGLPQRGVLVTQESAEEAITIADRVDLRVQKAMGLGAASGAAATPPPTSAPHPARGAAVNVATPAARSVPVPAPVSQLASSAAVAATVGAAPPPTPTSTPATPPAEPVAGDEVGDDSADGADDLDALPARVRARRRFPWVATLVALLTLVLGFAAGGAGGVALATGHTPAWLPLPPVLAQFAAMSTPTPTSTPSANVQPTGPFVAGDLLITSSGCGVTPETLTLRDTGTLPLAWSAGSPDASGAAFAVAPAGIAHPTAAGELAPGASITLTITGITPGVAHVVVVSAGGTISVAPGAC